jgi:FtsH-binding integral membrane protein
MKFSPSDYKINYGDQKPKGLEKVLGILEFVFTVIIYSIPFVALILIGVYISPFKAVMIFGFIYGFWDGENNHVSTIAEYAYGAGFIFGLIWIFILFDPPYIESVTLHSYTARAGVGTLLLLGLLSGIFSVIGAFIRRGLTFMRRYLKK